MTTNCWAILAIQPTRDLDAIKSARRLLIKKWHPDTVKSPQEKTLHTARCAEINAAYDEAVKRATIRKQLRSKSAFTVKRKPRTYKSRGSVDAFLSKYSVWFIYGALLCVLAFLRLVVPLIHFGMICVIALCLDGLLYLLLIRPILATRSLQRFRIREFVDTLTCLLLVVGNVFILRLWFSDGREPEMYLMFMLAAFAVPLWLFVKLRRQAKQE